MALLVINFSQIFINQVVCETVHGYCQQFEEGSRWEDETF